MVIKTIRSCSLLVIRIWMAYTNILLKYLTVRQPLLIVKDYIPEAISRWFFLVVNYKQVQLVKSIIKQADPRAFVVVTDAYDTFGEGWKPLPSADELQPE